MTREERTQAYEDSKTKYEEENPTFTSKLNDLIKIGQTKSPKEYSEALGAIYFTKDHIKYFKEEGLL